MQICFVYSALPAILLLFLVQDARVRQQHAYHISFKNAIV